MLEGGPPTDIWSTGAFSFESPLKDLIDSGDYSLEQLLGEDELLQELRGMHPQLVDFFGKEAAVQTLVEHVIMLTEKPVDDAKEQGEDEGSDVAKQKEHEAVSTKELVTIRYPYMACEVICCEITSIVDALVDGHVTDVVTARPVDPMDLDHVNITPDPRPQPILDLLFSVLYTTPSGQLDDYRAGYLDKVLSVLCRKRPQAMTVYVNETSGGLKLMKAMLDHLYSHSVLQIVQRLLLPHPSSFRLNTDPEEGDELDMQEDLFRCNWSESPEVIDCLLSSLLKNVHTEVDEQLRLYEAQNASEVLITVIQNSPLTSITMLTLTSDKTMERIAIRSSQLEEGEGFVPHDSALTCVMNVLESIVLQLGGYGSVGTAMEDDDAHPSMATADSLVKHLPLVLQNLGDLLKHPSTNNWKSPMQFSRESDQKILGTSRLKIVRLIETLVLLGNADIDKILCDSKCLETCLDLFWDFEWCSMLHQSVANLLVHIFEGANARASLQEFFLVKCNFLSRLMESFEVSDVEIEDYEDILRREAQEFVEQAMHKNEVNSIDTSDDGVSIDSDAAAPGEQAPKKLPISDDDVDVALEQQDEVTYPGEIDVIEEAAQADQIDSKQIFLEPVNSMPETHVVESLVDAPFMMSESSSTDAPTHIPSLRKGYMGHVIIICQALVHACTASGEQILVEKGPETFETSQSSENTNGENTTGESYHKGECDKMLPPIVVTRSSDDDDESYGDSEAPPSSPLVIAHLIHNHPLRERWHEFVTTTLASETAIQSTPLGGFNATSMHVDPLHSHRPGLHDISDYNDDDDDDDDDDDENIPGRGLTSGGDVIDMDDNDIEIAASMMEALNMPSRNTADQGEDSAVFKHGFQHSNEYMFDDPLGGNQQFANFVENDDNSDKEEDRTASFGFRRTSFSGADDPPVMDLFAGNFVGENGGFHQPTSHPAGFGDFANFDDAFAASGSTTSDLFSAFLPMNDLPPATTDPELGEDIFGSPEKAKEMIDDIFGSAPHLLLLDELSDGMPRSRAQENDEDPGAAKPEKHVSIKMVMPGGGKVNPPENDSSSEEGEPVICHEPVIQVDEDSSSSEEEGEVILKNVSALVVDEGNETLTGQTSVN